MIIVFLTIFDVKKKKKKKLFKKKKIKSYKNDNCVFNNF